MSALVVSGNDDAKKPSLKVLEYELDATEFRILYDFTGPEAEEMAKKYEAQLNNDVILNLFCNITLLKHFALDLLY